MFVKFRLNWPGIGQTAGFYEHSNEPSSSNRQDFLTSPVTKSIYSVSEQNTDVSIYIMNVVRTMCQ